MATLDDVITAINNMASPQAGAPTTAPVVDPNAAADAAQRSADAAERQLAAAQAAVDLNATGLEQLEQQENIHEKAVASLEAEKKLDEEKLNRQRELGTLTTDQYNSKIEMLDVEHENNMRNAGQMKEALTGQLKQEKELGDERTKGIEQATDAVKSFGAMFGIAASYQETSLGKLDTLRANIEKMSGPELDKLKAQMKETFSLKNLGASIFEKVQESTFLMAKAVDSANSSFNKATGAAGKYNAEMSTAIIGQGHLGVTIEGMGEAYGSLFENMSSFTRMSEENRVVMGQTVAALESVGVSGAETAVNLSFLTEVMGASADEAAAQMKGLAEFANTIGVAPAKMASEFKAAQPIMVKYGKDVGDKMFKKLAQTAKQTGIEMSALIGIAGQFDTFESAAQATGKLNALLGGPMLNSVELLTANEAERIDMLREGVQASGKSWDSMNRFEQQAVASAAGISDMTEAARLFGTSDEDFEANAEAAAELAEMSAKAQSAQEKMNALMMQFAAHIAPVVEGLSDMLSWVIKGIDKMGIWGKVISSAILIFGLLVKAITLWRIATKLGIIENIRLTATWIAQKIQMLGLMILHPIRAAQLIYMTVLLWLQNSAFLANIVSVGGMAVAAIAAAISLVASMIPALIAGTSAVWSFTVAILANPIGLLVAGVIALVAGIIGLIIYFDELDAWVQDVSGGFFDMWDVLLLLGGPFTWLILAGKKLYENWDAVVSGLMSLWTGFKDFMGTLWSGIVNMAKAPLNSLIKLFNDTIGSFTITLPAWIPQFGGETFGIPKIPTLAEGGVTTSAGAALVGEKGPEMVSLPAGANVTSNAKLKGAGVTKGATASSGPTTVILQLNEREFARAVIKVMDKKLNLSTG